VVTDRVRRVVSLVVGGALLVVVAAALLWKPTATTDDAPRVRVVRATVSLGFPGATGWREQPECLGKDTKESCTGEWLHDSGQRVQIFILPVADEGALARMTANLRATVIPQGGVVDEVDQNGQRVVRFLQPLPGTDSALISVNYLLAAPDNASMHIVTSVVPITDQVAGDGRLRDLLAFAAWLDAA
jgi:hypothetical protein